MAQDFHTVDLVSGTIPARPDRVILGYFTVATAAGGSAGASVTTAVTVPVANLPANYQVAATPNQDAVAYVTGKTSGGFNLVLNPRLAANTLAAGTVDLIIIA